MSETWKPVPGYEGRYEVSDLGRVRSLGFARGEKPRELVVCCGSQRYPYVNLQRKMHRVHTLVLTAFRGPAPAGCDASHLNDDPRDNRLVNLVWEPHRKSCQRRKPFDCNPRRGEAAPSAKLTEAQATQILALKRSGRTTIAVGAEFGVSNVQVGNIWRRKSWGHLPCV